MKAPIALIPQPCPGRRRVVWNSRWPICTTCDLQDDNATSEPAAVMQGDQPVCVNRRFHDVNVRPQANKWNPLDVACESDQQSRLDVMRGSAL